MTIGTDRTFVDPIQNADGSPVNVTGWTANLVIHKYNEPDVIYLTKSCTLVSSQGSNFPDSLQSVFSVSDTINLKPDQLEHYWERTDTGNDIVVSKGLFTLLAK